MLAYDLIYNFRNCRIYRTLKHLNVFWRPCVTDNLLAPPNLLASAIQRRTYRRTLFKLLPLFSLPVLTSVESRPIFELLLLGDELFVVTSLDLWN